MEPGRYVPDGTEGITRVADLPAPLVQERSRSFRRRCCPTCGRSCPRRSRGQRLVHDLGSLRRNRPCDLRVLYSKHYCTSCGRYFNVDLSDLAPAGSHYTHRVLDLAVRLVVEDGLPYRLASWHLWRDHRVFVPFATLQNWIESAGKKKRRPGRNRLP
jgi:hypothetical protein